MDFCMFGRHIHVEKSLLVGIVALITILGAMTGFVLSKNDEQIVINKTTTSEISSNEVSKVDKSIGDSKAINEEKIKVYVVGCVKNPGIIEINKGQIISEAIKAAGGPTNDADIYNINMVFKLSENVMLRINKKNSSNNTATINTNEATNNGDAGKGVEIIMDTGNAIVNGSKGNSEENSLININTATAAELDFLPGVGEKTAADIIAYREQSGGFKRIEDIMNVSRIGQKRFDTLKALITIE